MVSGCVRVFPAAQRVRWMAARASTKVGSSLAYQAAAQAGGRGAESGRHPHAGTRPRC